MIEVFNGAVHLVLGLVLIGAVLSKKVKDGIVVKAGLIFLALAFAAAGCMLLNGIEWGGALYLARALVLQSVGLLLLVLGYWIRRRRAGTPLTRISDWVDLDDSELPHVSGGRKP